MEGLAGLGGIEAFLPIVFMGVIFYFMLYRPQKKEQKARDAMLGALKKGNEVITIGGIVGTITRVGDEVVELKIAENTVIQVMRTAIGQVKNG